MRAKWLLIVLLGCLTGFACVELCGQRAINADEMGCECGEDSDCDEDTGYRCESGYLIECGRDAG